MDIDDIVLGVVFSMHLNVLMFTIINIGDHIKAHKRLV